MTNKEVEGLLLFYHEKGRKLPWRMNPTPYHVYVSEIRLQQTRVGAVIGYYHRFRQAFPTREDFVKADEDAYLKLWQGLGYYSRVKNRHKAMSILVLEHRDIPSDSQELLKLPGIGYYTSKSISSIAFQEKCVAVDGNLFRVFSRLTCYPAEFSEKGKRDCESFFYPFLPSRPGDFNQALMDLGERVCLPNGTPLCEECPFKDSCLSHQKKEELQFPIKKKPIEKKEEEHVLYFFRFKDKLLLRKRPSKGLLASLYEPINRTARTDSEEKDFLSFYHVQKREGIDLGTYHHVFSHRIWKRKGYLFHLDREPRLSDSEVLAGREEIESVYPLPSAFLPFRKRVFQ